MVAQATGIVLALGSAAAWGGADFSGGLASRHSHPLQVLTLSRLSAFVLLAMMAAVTRESLPPTASAAWAAAAGLSGALGIAALYRGLSIERSAVVAPTAGVLGAAFPVLYGAIFDGVLPLPQQAGLVAALVGIWLVREGHGQANPGPTRGLGLAAIAGIGFGGFFILLGQVDAGALFAPLAVTSCSASAVALLALAVSRTRLSSPKRNPIAVLAGVLDAVGVVAYLVAIRWVRLDVAAVLGSLYPAITVLLFRFLTKEPSNRTQWVGLAVCVAAIALIAL